MGLSRPRAILCDFGNTVLREAQFDVRAGLEAVLALATDARGWTVEKLAEDLGELLADLEPRRHASQLEFPPHMTPRLLYEPRGIFFDEPPERLEWVFWSAATSWVSEPGVEQALDSLAAAGLPCGIVSNTAFRGETLSLQLAIHGLDGVFSWVISSAEHVVRKPHHLLFQLAARRLGIPPEDTWFIGDSFECDIEGAAGVGMVPVWYRPEGPDSVDVAPAACAVASWGEFQELLEIALA